MNEDKENVLYIDRMRSIAQKTIKTGSDRKDICVAIVFDDGVKVAIDNKVLLKTVSVLGTKAIFRFNYERGVTTVPTGIARNLKYYKPPTPAVHNIVVRMYYNVDGIQGTATFPGVEQS